MYPDKGVGLALGIPAMTSEWHSWDWRQVHKESQACLISYNKQKMTLTETTDPHLDKSM